MRKKSINLLKSRSDFSDIFNETEECSHPLVHVGLQNTPILNSEDAQFANY